MIAIPSFVNSFLTCPLLPLANLFQPLEPQRLLSAFYRLKFAMTLPFFQGFFCPLKHYGNIIFGRSISISGPPRKPGHP